MEIFLDSHRNDPIQIENIEEAATLDNPEFLRLLLDSPNPKTKFGKTLSQEEITIEALKGCIEGNHLERFCSLLNTLKLSRELLAELGVHYFFCHKREEWTFNAEGNNPRFDSQRPKILQKIIDEHRKFVPLDPEGFKEEIEDSEARPSSEIALEMELLRNRGIDGFIRNGQVCVEKLSGAIAVQSDDEKSPLADLSDEKAPSVELPATEVIRSDLSHPLRDRLTRALVVYSLIVFIASLLNRLIIREA